MYDSCRVVFSHYAAFPVPTGTMAMRSDKLRERAPASRNEALANGVKATPTLFINGRRYDSYNHPDWIVDAVEYEYQKIATGSEGNPR